MYVQLAVVLFAQRGLLYIVFLTVLGCEHIHYIFSSHTESYTCAQERLLQQLKQDVAQLEGSLAVSRIVPSL